MKTTVLITGACKGLGKELAYVFAENGYGLILHGRSLVDLESMRRDIIKKHEVVCDISHGDLLIDYTISQLFDVAEKRDIGILINNAAVYINREFVNTSSAKLRQVINTNLIAPMLLTREIFQLFQRKQSGLVININSIAGKTGGDGEVAYCASKHGLSGFSKALQFDATRHNIRVIDVYLSAMKTDMTIGRNNREKLIDPHDAASFIVKACKEYQSLRINEIDIGRMNY